jgi:galactofuranose transport system permease protein
MSGPSHRSLAVRATESKALFPLIALALILLFDLVAVPGFMGLQTIDGHLYGNLIDIPRNGATTMLLAIGMTLVIATGGIDLSVGAVMAISAAVAALLINPDLQGVTHDPSVTQTPLWAVVLITLAVATACGVWNGALVAYGGIQPMVATLILMIAGRGIAQLLSNGIRIQIFYEPYAWFGNGWLVLPVSLYIVVGLFFATWLFTRRTALGMFIEAVGINARSAFYSGIDEKRVKLIAYAFCGFCAGLAGIVASSSIRTSDANNTGLNFELDAILAVVIGGTLLTGGRFSLMGSIVGALVIQAITTSMYAVGVPASALLAIKGFVVIVVILLFSVQVRAWIRGLALRRSTGQ